MNAIEWNAKSYRINGNPDFLVSGEFHYFRVPREDWQERLERFLEAGGNCVATYIPWILHEPTEGDIRFGDTPERNLESFLTLCRELDILTYAIYHEPFFIPNESEHPGENERRLLYGYGT